ARFLHSVFRKASRRARRAARSVLPPSVPAELVKFSVNGVLVLTFLWILKGLLELLEGTRLPAHRIYWAS
uniref:Uncharacterized protein n=2 Tax=Aegilops tauschii subsp. strangulata TaxID=200361 RepID=A0A453IL01_AEGTS